MKRHPDTKPAESSWGRLSFALFMAVLAGTFMVGAALIHPPLPGFEAPHVASVGQGFYFYGEHTPVLLADHHAPFHRLLCHRRELCLQLRRVQPVVSIWIETHRAPVDVQMVAQGTQPVEEHAQVGHCPLVGELAVK